MHKIKVRYLCTITTLLGQNISGVDMKQFKIISLATVILIVCTVIAYHNTASLGYDRQYLIYYDNDGVDIMDYHIEYSELKRKMNKISEIVPDEFVSI